MFEVLKFACELSSDATCAVLRHLQMIGEKEGLTAHDFTETPSVEDLSYRETRFMSICSDCFFFLVQRQADKLCFLFFLSVLITF